MGANGRRGTKPAGPGLPRRARYNPAMNLAARIQEQFDEHATALLAASEVLGAPLARAAECMVEALSDDHKIIACANAPLNAECERLVGALLGRFERERLALPALSLAARQSQDGPLAGVALLPDFARQIEGIARPGDVLVALSVNGDCENVVEAVAAAHERDMHVVAVTGRRGGAVAAALIRGDVHLAIPSERAILIEAMQRVVLNCLCDAIDWNFLGDEQ
jgi:D-sedoheptulose 7-phosphate isomerase